MRLLLDTHVAIWAVRRSMLIPDRVLAMIADPANEVFVSATSIWEIAIKHALKRVDSPPFSAAEALIHFATAGFVLLDVTPAHAACVETLLPIHADPFDRLLLAQATVESLRLVTHDGHLRAYSDAIIGW